ncbi:hypothetical protein GCM10027276_44340 [Comamonas piscis]
MRKHLQTLAAAVAMAVPGLSSAALITGTTHYAGDGVYSFRSTDLTYDSGGAAYSDLPVLMFCIDHGTQPPFGITSQFDSEAGASAIKGAAGAAGEAAIHWLLDRYYPSYYKTGSIEQRRALQYALWEIGNDYNGTAASIDVTEGISHPSTEDVSEYGGSDQAAFVSAYTTLYTAMKANLPSLRSSYRSSTYTIDLFRNQDPAYQNMAALIERAPPNTVPVAVPSITGTPQVGSTVTGSYTYADNNGDAENPSGTSYQFVTSPLPSISSASDGSIVASGTTGGAGQSPSYVLQPGDLNHYVFFCVTPAAQTGATPGLEVCTTAVGPVTTRVVQQTPTPVPGLGLWAGIALSLLLAVFGTARQRRR